MENQEICKARGELLVQHFDSNGNEIDRRHIPNLVVDVGRNWIAERMTSNTPALVSHMAVGTLNTPPAGNQTTLSAELARVTATSSRTNNSVTYNATFAAGVGTGAIVEAGLFNAASAGTMLARTTFLVVNKAAGDVVTITWTVTIL